MSTQSILERDKEHFSEKFEKHILWNADHYYMDKYFKVGGGMNYNEAMYYSKLGSIICTDNCHLVNWIEKKIAGKLEESCGVKKQKRTLQELLQLAKKHMCCDSETEALCECVSSWKSVEW